MKKNQSDHAKMLMKLAHNDLIAANAVVSSGLALNTVCFHAQQAAEKSLKAVLASHGLIYPKIHDLAKLIQLIDDLGCDLKIARGEVSSLTVYAVDIRYDNLEPVLEEASAAVKLAEKLYSIISTLLAADVSNDLDKPRDD